ncbi:CDK-activating kinase assembly factor [Auriculariales sp. MPI-PUGE-AT-0066]|nr:CDK-activating kinase assembly factor [Auriculariales sp. MPI-PUGE-AT-0066]
MQARSWLRGSANRRSSASTPNSRISSNAATPQPHTFVSTGYATALNGGVKDPSGKTTEFSSDDDMCPVCKSDRYLNPKLRLLVSSCYHKMCESCIDRLFTLGPAPCPICQKVQRKMGFAHQTFEDLTVEKEVAVRRRMHKEFNKRREDFVDIHAYNDYLEWVEEMTFNLINDLDLAETEAQIAQFKAENAAVLEQNLQLEERATQELQEDEERERALREQNARALQTRDDAERAQREQERRELIDQLQSSDAPARRLIKQAVQKRMSQRTEEVVRPVPLLRSRIASTIADPPYKPLADDWWDYSDLYTMQNDYDDPMSDAVRSDPNGVFRAGGYIVQEAWGRALSSAVAGLDMKPVSVPDVIMANS